MVDVVGAAAAASFAVKADERVGGPGGGKEAVLRSPAASSLGTIPGEPSVSESNNPGARRTEWTLKSAP